MTKRLRAVSKTFSAFAIIIALLFCSCPKIAQAQTPVTLGPAPEVQFLSATGAPLAGGKVFTYAAGTNNSQPTYSDSTGLVQNQNPIILDSGGFPSSGSARVGLWFSALAYKIIVQNSAGVQQYSVDNFQVSPFLNGNNSWTGNETRSGTEVFNGAAIFSAGGALSGTFTGSPTFSGTPTFSGSPIFASNLTIGGTVKAGAFISSSANPAATGIVRLTTGDSQCWRNNANSADLCLSKNSSDVFQILAPFISTAFTSSTASPAVTGQVRLSNTDFIAWRNQANGADNLLAKTNGVASSETLTWNSNPISTLLTSASGTFGGNTGPTVIYSVPAASFSMYLICPYISLTQAATTSSTLPSIQILYTDLSSSFAETLTVTATSTANTVGTLGFSTGTGTGAPSCFPIRAQLGSQIKFQTTGYTSVGATSMQYALLIPIIIID